MPKAIKIILQLVMIAWMLSSVKREWVDSDNGGKKFNFSVNLMPTAILIASLFF
jgi:hypothetical protein